jgi:hypothetical protein
VYAGDLGRQAVGIAAAFDPWIPILPAPPWLGSPGSSQGVPPPEIGTLCKTNPIAADCLYTLIQISSNINPVTWKQ